MSDESRMDRVEKQLNGVMIVLAILIAVVLAVLWGIVPIAHAQSVTFCNPIGSMTACTDSRGNTTTITPLGAGISAWSNNHGQGGTIVQPLPTPTTPTPQTMPQVQPPILPVWVR